MNWQCLVIMLKIPDCFSCFVVAIRSKSTVNLTLLASQTGMRIMQQQPLVYKSALSQTGIETVSCGFLTPIIRVHFRKILMTLLII